jgi:hypothetical protein
MENDNIEQIAETIFRYPPKDPCSIELQLDTLEGEGESIEVVFNILCVLTLKGVNILFGEKNIIELEISEFLLLQKYVRSYGYEMIVTANDTDRSPWYFAERNISVYRFKISFERYYG